MLCGVLLLCLFLTSIFIGLQWSLWCIIYKKMAKRERWFHTLVQNTHEPGTVSAAKLGQLCAQGDIAGLRAALGNPEAAESKLKAEAVDRKNGTHAGTPLFFAAGHGHLEMVKMLIENYSANPDKGRPIDINPNGIPDPRTLDGSTPILVASKMVSVIDVIKKLKSVDIRLPRWC